MLPFGTEARPLAARTLRLLAVLAGLVMDDEVLDAGVDSHRLRDAVRGAADGIDGLAALVRHEGVETGSDPFAAISVVHQLRRCRYAFEAEGLVETVR